MTAAETPGGPARAPGTEPALPPSGRPPLHVSIIIAGVFAVSLLKGLRMPNLWSATHMTFNYSQGFIRRGLFGQILRVVLGKAAYHYNTLALLSVILFVLAVLSIGRLTRRMLATDGGDHGLAAVTLAFAASPGVVFLAHEIGYLDYVGLVVVPLFIVWAARGAVWAARGAAWPASGAPAAARGARLWAVFYVAAALSVVLALIHESMMIMFAPTMWLVMACHIAVQSRAGALPRRTRAWLVGHAIMAAAVALVVSSAVGAIGTRSPARIMALRTSIALSADFPLRGDGFEALFRPVRDNLLVLMPRHWSFAENQRYLTTGLVVSFPGLAALSVYGVRLLGRVALPRLTRAILRTLLLMATLAPLVLNLLGWDSARWNAICFVAAFNGVATLRLFFCARAATPGDDDSNGRARVDDPWMITLAAAAIVAGLTSNYGGFLFDGYVVQWFPFGAQLRSLFELVQGGFHFMPRL